MEFKVRTLDFLSIYVKHNQQKGVELPLIKGLLKALTVAHKDQNTTLFERIKTVLTLIAKQSTAAPVQSDKSECTMLITEMMAFLMKQNNDAQLQKAYSDSFVLLTKHFWESPQNQEFLTFTFKELIKRFLGGRCQSLKPQLFQQVFESCPCLGWSVSKQILKCFLTKAGEEEGSRGNH